MQEQLQRVAIWSKALRVCHWGMGLSVLGLLATGWLLSASPALAPAARDWHYLLAWPLMASLVARVWLLLTGRGVAHWRDCWPGAAQRAKFAELLRFYASFGRMPLPAWYAHNPLWGPIYLLLFAALAVQVLSGLAIGRLLIDGVSLTGLHGGLATGIAIFTLLHLLAVVLHELGGEGGDVSAMLNGKRVFQRQQADVGQSEGRWRNG